jgi:3-hydroxyacyl-CoA dehydrogenase
VKIAVLGAGAGGTAVAFDCAAHDHDVRIFDFPSFPDNIATIAEQQGIHASGDLDGTWTASRPSSVPVMTSTKPCRTPS